MSILEFRPLRADEIDCRVSQVKQNGCVLLLYKDARCDQIILDETVGAMNWQRHHSRDNANCCVSIWDSEKAQWIEKEDTGTESYTEKEKGLASDSFKRACFNWGIGRELYTAPFVWIPAEACEIQAKGQGYTTYDRFEVKVIDIQHKRIVGLQIVNCKRGTVVYSYGTLKSNTANKASSKPIEPPVDIKCIVCDKVIPSAAKGGKTLSGAQIAEQTGGMCIPCYKKAQSAT